MPDSAPAPLNFYVNKDGTATLIAYIEGNAATPITQATLHATNPILYWISLVDENEPDLDTAVTGHNGVSIDKTAAVFDTPQVADPRWNPAEHEGNGYNFLYQILVNTNPAFTIRPRRYLIRVKFTPATGQVFWAEWIGTVR